ncbi:MAG TPA: hypothetical protein VGN17_20280 [Bryobacteraceae bacterium]|jgi:hypothetical protein
MNRKIVLLNVALVLAIAGLGYMLRVKWLEGEARTKALVAQKVPPAAVMPPPAPVPVAPVAPADYLEVATRTLYSSDRNPNIVVPPPPPPKPEPPPPVMPALPIYYGQMSFGEKVVVLALPSSPEQKSYSVGQKVGDFKLLAFNRETITFDWNGKEVEKKLEELAPKAAQPTQQQAPGGPAMPAAALQPSAPQTSGVSSIGGNSTSTANSPKDPLSGPDMGGGLKSCVMGDTSAAGTVISGWKKVVGGGLLGMGQSCHWEQQK